jgi:acyl-CoA thioester hydrolase
MGRLLAVDAGTYARAPLDAGCAQRRGGGNPMTAAAPLMLHRETVQPGWVDYNDHLNDGYYVVIFSHATDALMDHIALGEAERRRTGHTIFTLEMHINYLKEVRAGSEVRIATQILGHDQKRLHVFHTMFEAGSNEPAATNEQMLVNIDMNGPRSAPFLPDVLAKIEAIARIQEGLPRPANAGRSISLTKKG